MKKFIAFMSAAAVAAVALAGGAQEDVTSWYTPEPFETTSAKVKYNHPDVGEVAFSFVVDESGNPVSRQWGESGDTGNPDINGAILNIAVNRLNVFRNTERIKTLAETMYDNAITRIEPNPTTGGFNYYTTSSGGGEKPSGNYTPAQYSVDYDANAKTYHLTKDSQNEGYAWKAFVGEDGNSLAVNGSTQSPAFNKLEVKGWNDDGAYASAKLKDALKDGTTLANWEVVMRDDQNRVKYVSVGKFEADGGCGIADECSITTNANGNAGKMALKGYHDDTTEVGAIPYCALNEMGWLNPGTNGAILVSGIGAPRFTAKTSRNYYYGTSKPADPGETVLGWHELPNVTTNYVEGDERTITADNTIDEESGEICKKLKLFAEPSGSAFTPATVYGAYMDGEGHLAWQPIIGDKIAPLLADGITTTNNNGKVGICGFNDAQTLSYLRKASSNSVEWASLGGLVAARHGIVLEQNTNSQFIIAMQNYTNRATRSTHTAQNNVLLSRNEDGDLEWLTDVDFVGLESVIGIGAVKAEPDGQVSSAYDVKLRPSSAYGTVITGVDENGNWTRASIEPMVTNMFDKIRAETITNLVNDFYLLKAGDKMTGSLEIQSGISAASGDIANITNVNATIAHAEVDDLIVTNGCWLPYADKTMVQTATNETGEAVYFTLDDYVGFASAPAAELAVANATNAMAQAWTVGQLTTTGTTELNAATTIGGKAAVLVDDPPEGQPKIVSMKIENDKLVITDANGVEHRFTPDSL